MDDLTVIYYTDSQLAEPLASRVRAHLLTVIGDTPLISVSQQPLAFGHNICVGEQGRSLENIYRAVLAGCRAATTPYVAMAEHDCLYTPEHFAFRAEAFAYNVNRWTLHADMNLFSWRERAALSQLVVPREMLIRNLETRLRLGWEQVQRHTRDWFEPGVNDTVMGMAKEPFTFFRPERANIDINHGRNFSGKKFLANDILREVPGWGDAYDIKNLVGEVPTMRPFQRVHFKAADDLWQQRMQFTGNRGAAFFESFAPFVADVLAGKEFDPERTPYYQYLLSRRTRRPQKRVREHIDLIRAIAQDGIGYPLEFYRHGRQWRMIDGSRRLTIAHVLGLPQVPCRVFGNRGRAAAIGLMSSLPKSGHSRIECVAAKQTGRLGKAATNQHYGHAYTRLFDRELGQWSDSKIKILEFGVFAGASLLLWHDAFPKAQIVGVDRKPDAGSLVRGLDRVKILHGLQGDERFLSREVKPLGPFHVIVDDAAHRPMDQLSTFKAMWPRLAPGGVYVMEDLYVDYIYRKGDLGTLEWLKGLVDRIYIELDVASVHFDRDITFIRKSVRQAGA